MCCFLSQPSAAHEMDAEGTRNTSAALRLVADLLWAAPFWVCTSPTVPAKEDIKVNRNLGMGHLL